MIKGFLKVAGMPEPICEIVGNLVPKMLQGAITSPQIIEAVMAYCLRQAQEGVEKEMWDSEKFKPFKGKKIVFWLGIERTDDGRLASFVGVQDTKRSTDSLVFLGTEGYVWLEDFICQQIRKIRTYINIEQLKEEYLPILQEAVGMIGNASDAISADGLDHVLKVVLAIFDAPEEFVTLILGVISENMSLIEQGISQNIYGNMPIKMCLYGTASPFVKEAVRQGLRLQLEIGKEGAAGTTLWDVMNPMMQTTQTTRPCIPHEEVLARMLMTQDKQYFEKHFADLVQALPATTTLPTATPTVPPVGKEQDEPKKKSPKDIFDLLNRIQQN